MIPFRYVRLSKRSFLPKGPIRGERKQMILDHGVRNRGFQADLDGEYCCPVLNARENDERSHAQFYQERHREFAVA